MSADHDLQRVALAMIAAADQGRSVAAALKERCPDVHRQVRRDAAFPGIWSQWGRCVNFDAGAKQIVVHPAILAALGELAGIPVRGRVVHAGLQHTYGYLFSTIATPFGFKRDRWTTPNLERGLGVDESLLGDRPGAGTLLANPTWTLGRIALRGRTAEAARLRRSAAAVAPALVDYEFDSLKVDRIVERAVLARNVAVAIVTDLVTLPRDPTGDRLLVYSTAVGAGALRLVTGFPIRPKKADELRAAARPGQPVDVRLKYNAYVQGLAGRTVRGVVE